MGLAMVEVFFGVLAAKAGGSTTVDMADFVTNIFLQAGGKFGQKIFMFLFIHVFYFISASNSDMLKPLLFSKR